jgi:hypothetical protein
MKTKLTLTVEKEIVERAKTIAANRGVSLSKMFEEVFSKEDPEIEQTEAQKAAISLLKKLESMKPTPSLKESDKELRRRYLLKKYG